ncbi:MAG TPA: ABC transporter permease [Aggregatilineales bacterium]|nr:ABC transporter permease [Aggregatilineales bacterium]
MTNLLTVFRYEITRQFWRKAYLFTTFGIPVLGVIVVMGILVYQNLNTGKDEPEDALEQDIKENQEPFGYVDLTGTFAPPVEDSILSSLLLLYEDVAAGEDAVQSGEIQGLYVIEKDYFDSGDVTLVTEAPNLNALGSSIMEVYLLQSLGEGVDSNVLARLRYPVVNMEQQRLTSTGEPDTSGSEDANFVLVYVFAMVLMFSTFTSSGYLMQSISDEKESKILEIILTSVRPFPLLVGKTMAMGLLGLFQILIWLGTAFALLNVLSNQIVDLSSANAKPETIIIALIYFVLGFGFVGAIFAIIGTLMNSTREGSQVAGWIVFPLIIPLFFTALFAGEPNGTLPTILSLIPVTAPLSMVMRSAVSDVPLWELMVSIMLLVVLVIFSLWMAGRMFRVQSLLRGTTPKLRDLPKLILQG